MWEREREHGMCLWAKLCAVRSTRETLWMMLAKLYQDMETWQFPLKLNINDRVEYFGFVFTLKMANRMQSVDANWLGHINEWMGENVQTFVICQCVCVCFFRYSFVCWQFNFCSFECAGEKKTRHTHTIRLQANSKFDSSGISVLWEICLSHGYTHNIFFFPSFLTPFCHSKLYISGEEKKYTQWIRKERRKKTRHRVRRV